ASLTLILAYQPATFALGHLTFKSSGSNTLAISGDVYYIHAHALNNTPTGQVHFMTSFPQAGKYKLWGQFNRNGKIITADFWINVV
ncbi:hypothetical protein H6G68_26375, partial [Anabaena catenula FACHB-362]|nr:hypothetical protein [Anabaena catenula FACHB-362]